MVKQPAPGADLREVVVLVEGNDEVNFLKRVLGQAAYPRVTVESADGKDKFRAKLKDLVARTGFHMVSKVVVVTDADDNPTKALRARAGDLENAGLPAPVVSWVPAVGAIDGRAIETQVIILPGPDDPGELETLFLRSLADDAGLQCVRALVQCWREANLVVPADDTKMLVQAWLARYARGKYKLLAGSFDKDVGAWNLDHPAFAPLLAHLRAL